MPKHILKISIFAIILFASCTSANNNCYETFDIQAVVNFYKITGTRIDALSIDSINVKGVGTDSILYKNRRSVNSIKLPLKKSLEKSDTQCAFEIIFNDVTDIVTINYTNKPYYVSLECGCEILPVIESITTTRNFIDSVEIVDKEVKLLNPKNAENIKIYHFY